MSRRHAANLALGTVVTIACFAAALWGFDRNDYAQIAISFRRADYRTLPVLLALLALFFWLKAMRWSLLLRPLRAEAPLTTAHVFPALLIGFTGNNLLPAHLGEFLRVYVLGRQFGLSKTAIFSTVVLERVCDVAAILAILGWGLAFAPQAPPEARTTGYLLAAMLAVGLVGITVYALWTAPFVRTIEWILARTPFLPAGLKRKAAEMLEAGALGMAALRSGWLALWITVTSLAHWLLGVGMIQAALVAFDIDQPPAVAAVVLGVVAFGVTVPSTPGFFGVIQIAFRLSLVPFGVAATDAVASSVYYHLIQWGAVTLVGLYFLQRLGFGLRLGQLERVAEETVAATEEEIPLASSAQ